eukprot:TRINITY_DN3235_c0_g3_i1.p1 TRINITY_DN3235_c0_g3~~TRINITY_DN3235_c0_g3_i1.p1  ORF type:complete len:163 (+),score=63.66 TRINITY_DN3235_c0_g3_i1:47-535(+)
MNEENTAKNVSYIIVAELNDNKPKIIHQYPMDTGEDDQSLLEHMFPPLPPKRDHDSTLFFLGRNTIKSMKKENNNENNHDNNDNEENKDEENESKKQKKITGSGIMDKSMEVYLYEYNKIAINEEGERLGWVEIGEGLKVATLRKREISIIDDADQIEVGLM